MIYPNLPAARPALMGMLDALLTGMIAPTDAFSNMKPPVTKRQRIIAPMEFLAS
jgi:hypothetical protein